VNSRSRFFLFCTFVKRNNDFKNCIRSFYRDSKFYEKRLSWKKPLPLNAAELMVNDVCHGLYVECGHARKTVDGKLYHWHADILVDGRIDRSGVLIEDSWVLVKRTIDFKYVCLTRIRLPTRSRIIKYIGFTIKYVLFSSRMLLCGKKEY
jgi:hypothetical protein